MSTKFIPLECQRLLKKLLSLIFTFLLSFSTCNAMDELAKTYPEYSKYIETKNFGYGWCEDFKHGKLYFYYGTMGSGKSALAIEKANSIGALVYLPKLVESSKISSRNGKTYDITCDDLRNIESDSVLIIDEAQFLSNDELELIKKLLAKNVTIFCFGLLTTFQKQPFDCINELSKISYAIREIGMKCENCKKSRAIYNFRTSSDNKLVSLGKDQYMALCSKCFEIKDCAKFLISGLFGK